jgi:DNA polymerase
VFGEGDEGAALMFIGEGPGADEDKTGRPFVGRAGQLLTKMIEAMGLTRQQVYIANVVKCRPPENREPFQDEVAACMGFLRTQIKLINPKVIVCLGATSAGHLLNPGKRISNIRGHFLEYEGLKVMPTYHPAYLLRNETKKRDVWNDLKLVMAELGLQQP